MSPVGVVLACTLAEIAELEYLVDQLDDARGYGFAIREQCEVKIARLVERAHHEWAELAEACRDQDEFLKVLAVLGAVH